MKRVTILLICFCLILFMNGCKNKPDNNHASVELSVNNYSDETDRYYEQTSDGYKAAFYTKNEITIEEISNWLAACETSERYYHYIYSDPDSWDMFIYYAPENAVFHGSSFKFSVDGSLVKVYITNDPSNNISEEYILIRIQAPMRGAWPNDSELYMEGVEIEKQDETVTTPMPEELPSASPATPDSVAFMDIDNLDFSDLSDMMFVFGSGVGAWSTEVRILPDGSFVGLFHDSDMGDLGEAFPEGTVYTCSFKGKFSSLEKTGAYEYSMKCESLVQEGTPGDEMIADGKRYIVSEPYGFDDADVFLLYLPGKNVEELPEDFLEWVGMPRATDFQNVGATDFWGLYNVTGKQGFRW